MHRPSFLSNLRSALFIIGMVGLAEPVVAQVVNYATPYTFTTFAGSPGLRGSTDGSTSAARFYKPQGVAVDSAGNLYVAESENAVIRKITPTGIVSTVAGSPGVRGTADGTGAAARFTFVLCVALDSGGNLYATDSHRIRKIAPSGVVTTLAGSEGNITSIDGIGSAAGFRYPYGLAVDSAGNVYVADADDNIIRKITPTGAVSTIAGRIGISGVKDGVGTAAQFDSPVGIAVDAAGNIFVAETSAIRKITTSGSVTTVAGGDKFFYADGIGTAAGINEPNALAVDAVGNLFFTSYFSSTVRKIAPDGVVSTVAGSVTPFFPPRFPADGTGPTVSFVTPAGITIDTKGALYVADADSYTIRKGTPDSVASFTVTSPRTVTVSPSSTAVFSVTGTSIDLTYQWRKDGVVLTGATSATLVIPGATSAQAGSYTCAATNASGTVVSAAAALAISATTDFGRLINLSILTSLTADSPLFTVGAVLGGAGTSGKKPLVIRAVGPSLTPLGVTGVLPDPKLDVFTGSAITSVNDNWGGGASLTLAMSQVGAFALTGGTSRDAAVAPSLDAGGYTVQVTDAAAATGVVIAELYDATAPNLFTATTPRLINVSVLKQIPAGSILTAGFVIGGQTAKTVLIRAIGPGLAAFGVGSPLADPQLALFSGSAQIAANDNWGGDAQLSTAGAGVGAFTLANGNSKDAMLLITLPPGGYTAQITGVGGISGNALIEVYEVP